MNQLNQTAQIKSNLNRELEGCKLSERIAFEDSALEELLSLYGGDWEPTRVYAGTAVLDALQNQKPTITAEDIKKVDPSEAVKLMLGGKDIWEDVRYIGTTVPNMLPSGVQLKRKLSLWDADRTRDSIGAVQDGRLPKYALVDKIQYEPEGMGLGRPEVKIPFRYAPSQEEVRAVAESLAGFVTQKTGETQKVKDISGRSGIQYFVQAITPPGRDPLLTSPNYRVAKSFAFIEGAQGAVSIN